MATNHNGSHGSLTCTSTLLLGGSSSRLDSSRTMATWGLVTSGASSDSSAPREFWRDMALRAAATSPPVSAVWMAASMQMMVFSLRAARLEVEVEVDFA